MYLVDLELLVSSRRRRQPMLLIALELLVSSKRIGIARSKGLDTDIEIQIDFWNRHLHNILWIFSHEIKELLCKCLFSIMCYLMCFVLLVHMTFICKPFLPRYN
jgi:hypothetical protein